ncbi:hypothetical protein [Butyrivibrio fibrisolvens]|uniref:Antitoxin VbhA domain-containing protein n=1 Tax=Butyrivibrio fibrisolvens TaxID=831 RepID=A0A1H9PJR8_BUTFI|nr:hypothetical protein [Butyrivibrio fibrisolvens]PWT27427.1 hypothetical protein CPT75_10120 [Butyrivibrio fibrisolvens]SER48079.1 hypothetical protein SAMN04487884_10648 [Butyrivibrio fibrisolvens]
MKNDEFQNKELTPAQIDMIRQTMATLSIENLKIGKVGTEAMGSMLKGDISIQDYQKMLKENYKASNQQ